MNQQTQIPVLLVCFNRPDTTRIVFNRIREARPRKLFVAIDGPNLRDINEVNLVEQVKVIVRNVDWPCEVDYKYNQSNKGAEITVSSAIRWAFEKEEYLIILEDDIVAPLAFFRFAEEMLIRYKDQEKVGTVTGSNFTPIHVPNNTDYFFAKYGHTWGWATWKRAWKDFDLEVKIPAKHLSKKFLQSICNSRDEVDFYYKKFQALKNKESNVYTWDNISLYFHRINERLSIIPRVNLTYNIGIQGLHARGKTEHHFRPVDEKFEVKNHPEKVECYTRYDKHHFKYYIIQKNTLIIRIFKKIVKIFKNKKLN